MPIPEPWSTVLLVFTGIGALVSAAAGLAVGAWAFGWALTLGVRTLRATGIIVQYAWHRKEFKQWLAANPSKKFTIKPD